MPEQHAGMHLQACLHTTQTESVSHTLHKAKIKDTREKLGEYLRVEREWRRREKEREGNLKT